MSVIIFVDSDKRSANFPLPSEFTISVEQTRNWREQSRFVLANPPSVYARPMLFLQVVEIFDFWVFPGTGSNLTNVLKLNFYNISHNDILVNTLDNIDVKFVLSLDKTEADGSRLYVNKTGQVMRLSTTGSFVFQVLDLNNNILNVGDNGRIVCTFKITPFIHHYKTINKEIQPRVG